MGSYLYLNPFFLKCSSLQHIKMVVSIQLKTTIFNIEKANNLEIVIEAEANIERLFE